jgi:nucleoside-diphosphate-sugar epimerase
VTGGAGFLGRALVRRLSADGWAVTGVDVRPAPRVVTGDVTRRGAWTAALDGADLVVHAAALQGDAGRPRDHWDVNVAGARTVAAAALEAGVGRLVHLSTTAVLGDEAGRHDPGGADEDQPVRMTGDPTTDAGVAAEHQVLAVAARGLQTSIVRLGEVYGPHSAQWTVRVVELIRSGLFVLVDGGAGILSPVYVDDAVDGILAVALQDAGGGEIVHVTGGRGVPAAEFFGCYAAMAGRTLPSLPRAAAVRLTGGLERVMRPLGLAPPLSPRALDAVSRRGTYSIAKADRLLGWRPQVPLEEGMARTEAWLRDVGLLGRVSPT